MLKRDNGRTLFWRDAADRNSAVSGAPRRNTTLPIKITRNEGLNEEKEHTLAQLTNIKPFLKTSKARIVSKQRKKTS